jgi:regulator of protease activity HflC (stomatin/prohibitin superfamily)
MKEFSVNEDEININNIDPPKKETDYSEEQNQLLNSNKSKEKILHLKPGSIIWKRVCSIFAISFVVFIISMVLSFVVSPFLFIFVGISGLGILFAIIFTCCCSNGFITIAPNEAVVYHYYGRYLGTVKDNGYFFGYPMAKTFRMSLKSNQYNGSKLKVNERDGNPVELGIVVVWKIGDTAKAQFDVENYRNFIEAQAEAAIRYIGCKYPYEPVIPGEVSLRSGHEIINKELKEELERRIAVSGIQIEDARVTEISYGAEVAKMMLQKQASNAAVFAKDAIVKGATNAVLNSLSEFEKSNIQLSDDEKANYIIEMMNTLCVGSGIHKIV